MRIPVIVLFTASFLLLPAFSADAEQTPGASRHGDTSTFCDYLIEKNNLDAAMLEFERSRETGGFDGVRLGCELGKAFLRENVPDKAECFFEDAYSMAPPDSPGFGVAFNGLMRAYLFQHKGALARQELSELDSASRESIGFHDLIFLKGATDAASLRVDSARATLKALANISLYNDRVRRLDSLLCWYKAQTMKNPLEAYLYSSAVPGLGHWYAGDRKKARASFGLMALLSGLICWEGYRFYCGDTRQRFVSGMDIFLLSTLAWRRYYARIRSASYESGVRCNRDVQLRYRAGLRRILIEE